jgi:hypothetical protein
VPGTSPRYYFLADREFPRSVLLIFVTLDYPLLLGWRAT